MSWFARSIANTFNLDIEEEEEDNSPTSQKPETRQQQQQENKLQEEEDDNSSLSPSRGVKQDLSEITKTLSKQFWGVASFLSPPPEDENNADPHSDPEEEVDPVLGIRRDIEELGGRFQSGISKLSSNIDVAEITKLASNFFSVDGDGEAVGVTEDVLSFVRDVTLHPETWLDFPLPDDEEDSDDFELSDAQQPDSEYHEA